VPTSSTSSCNTNIVSPELIVRCVVYQGLIPWAWIEASTKGAVLLFVASEAEFYAKSFGAPDFVAGISGGMVGGLAQAYATMGFCTCRLSRLQNTRSLPVV
jgi:hypothetical protein